MFDDVRVALPSEHWALIMTIFELVEMREDFAYLEGDLIVQTGVTAKLKEKRENDLRQMRARGEGQS